MNEGLHMTLARHRSAALLAAALAAVLALAGCSGSASGSGASPSSSPSSDAPSSARGGGPAAPAASGLVAAISGSTMQVQNQQTGQVAVSWSGSTKFSHTVATTLAAVRAGDCVTAIAPTGTDSSATSFTATTMTVSAPVNGTCGGGFGGARTGQRPSQFPSGQRPSGFPGRSGRPGGSGRPGFGAIASGKVTSVSRSSVVIAARQFGSNASSTANKTVTIGSKTKITTEAATTATSVKVGVCVTAQGKADSTGTVAATRVRITQASNGQCTLGFGGGRGGAGGGSTGGTGG